MKKQYSQNNIAEYPPFLTEEEEKAVGKRIVEGDFSAKEALVEHNLRIVFFTAKKYAGAETEFEDLMSVGSIGLLKAVNGFDPSRNIRFTTYASKCVKNEMLMYLRKEKNVINVPLEDHIERDNQEDEVWKETERRINCAQIEQLTELLPEKQREVAVLRFGLKGEKERNQKEVAELLGVSQSYVSKTEKKFVRILKENMIDDTKISEKM